MKYLRNFNFFSLIAESRRWNKRSFNEEIEYFVNKYKNNKGNIFFSFRSDNYVSMTNPKNSFNTPTGIYTYTYDFFKEIMSKQEKGSLNYAENFPFTGNKKANYLYIYKVKDSAFLIDNETTYEEILPFAKKLLGIFGNNSRLLNSYLKSENEYISTTENIYSEDIESSAGIFWVLIYDLISNSNFKGNIQHKFTNICRKIGIDGFIDYGDGYIHTNEPEQAVLLKGRSIIEDYTIISINEDKKNTIFLSKTILELDLYDLSELYVYNFGYRSNDYLKPIAMYLLDINKLDFLIKKVTESSISKYEKSNLIKFVNKLISQLPDKEILKYENNYKLWSYGNFKLNSDGSIDVDSSVYVPKYIKGKLPIKFKKVNGDFDCSYNNLTTLENLPNHIEGDFDCSSNNLTTLKVDSIYIKGDVSFHENKLTTIKGINDYIVDGSIGLESNKITTLDKISKKLFYKLDLKGNPVYELLKLIGGRFQHLEKIVIDNNKIDIDEVNNIRSTLHSSPPIDNIYIEGYEVLKK